MSTIHLPRHKLNHELIPLEETLRDLLSRRDLLGLLEYVEIVDVISIASHDKTVKESRFFVIRSPIWAGKNSSRDEDYVPKTKGPKFRKEYRRMAKSYKTSKALPVGFAWHSVLVDQAVNNLFYLLKYKQSELKLKISDAQAIEVITKILSSVIINEIRNHTIAFDDQDTAKPIDLPYFKLKPALVKKKLQKLLKKT